MAAELRAADAAGHPGERSFVVDVNPFTIGQAPDWLDRTHVVWQDPSGQDVDDDGEIQIHRSALDGTERVCLTCGLDGPNQVPVVQPHGQWILFHSWSGHAVKIGSPGFGGIGSDGNGKSDSRREHRVDRATQDEPSASRSRPASPDSARAIARTTTSSCSRWRSDRPR
jgi:hypothetical protein